MNQQISWWYLRKVAELWEDVHVSKAVNGDDWTVSWRLMDMEERVAELITVSVQEVNGTCQMGEEEEILKCHWQQSPNETHP